MDKSSEKEFLIKFGQNLRRLRKQKGFTQEQLANELDIEISQISRIERGVINTTIVTVQSIVKCLQIKANELFD
ncbi:MAG: hypothetical protein Tsb004_20730 [Allomuricauda sp.]